MAPGGPKAVSVHSRSVIRAMASNRECQRLYHTERRQITDNKHRARCNINQEIQHIKADMHKLRMKTPTLSECMSGKTLCGLDGLETQNQREQGPDNKITGEETAKSKKKTKRPFQSRVSNISTISTRPSTVPVANTEDTRAKIVDFFERSKHLLEKPQVDEPSVPSWGRGSRSAHAFYPIQSSSGLDTRPQTTIFGTDIKLDARQTQSAKTSSSRMKKNKRRVAPETLAQRDVNNNPVNKEDLTLLIQSAWKGSMCSANPYQAFFKPETSTIRLAHQMVLVSRKLKNISVSREKQEKAVEFLKLEKERKKGEAEEEKKKNKWFHVDSEDFD